MSLTQILLFFHILGFVLWLGAGVTVGALNLRVSKSKNTEKIYDSVKTIDWLSKKIFIPASLVTVLAGVLLVIFSKWISFFDFWILLSIGGVILTFFLGGILIPKISEKIFAFKEHGEEKKVINAHHKLIFTLHLDSIIILVVLFDMVIKPELNDLKFLIIALAFLIITIGLAYRRMKKELAR